MAYLTRFTKNVQKQANFFSNFFMLVSKGAKLLYSGEVLKSYIFLRLDFHPIALLNVEAKLFFILISKRLEIQM